MADGKENRIVIGIVSGFVVLTVLGIVIFRKGTFRYDKNAKWAQDIDTLNMVKMLHPKVRNRVSKVFTEIERKTPYVMKGTSGLRDTDLQAMLEHQNPNNATAGLSDHEYGFAIDVNAKKNGQIVLRKSSSKSAWENSGIVDIFKKHGFKWGGDFRSYHDPIHFYDDFGIEAPLMAGMPRDSKGYIKV